jgi:hypothetical protein
MEYYHKILIRTYRTRCLASEMRLVQSTTSLLQDIFYL